MQYERERDFRSFSHQKRALVQTTLQAVIAFPDQAQLRVSAPVVPRKDSLSIQRLYPYSQHDAHMHQRPQNRAHALPRSPTKTPSYDINRAPTSHSTSLPRTDPVSMIPEASPDAISPHIPHHTKLQTARNVWTSCAPQPSSRLHLQRSIQTTPRSKKRLKHDQPVARRPGAASRSKPRHC